jgi:hypothetical protein
MSYQQDDWSLWHPLTEFTTNNHWSETTGVTPIFSNNGSHPHLNFDLAKQQALLENHDVQECTTKLQEIHPLGQSKISFAQAKQQENADPHRNLVPAYQIGDLVWLNARNIITRHSSVKLDHK